MSVKNGEIRIRPAQRADMEAVKELVQELFNYLARDLERDVFDIRPPRFHCLLAETRTERERKIIGCATYGITYSSRKGYCMRLQILFVSRDHRRRGIGRKLFSAVAKEVLSSGCNRLLFLVNHWNDGARLFYEGIGALNLRQWDLYEISDDALRNAALESL